MSLAPSALAQLDSACELFAKAARGFRATKVLNIMLNLQRKAHYCLDEYRKGHGSPLTRVDPSDPNSPAEDDELAVLGGKTRYVTKAEPSSPRLMERSPTSQNPVVPLPLPSTIQNDVDPNLVRYLQSFQPGHRSTHSQHSQSSYSEMQPAAGAAGYSDVDQLSPVSMYGMATMQTPTFAEPSSYMQQSMQQNAQGSSQTMVDIPGPSSFPQYFPVYDYSTSSTMSGVGTNGFGHSPLMENAHPASQQQRKGSGSPEANLQTTWQDYVDSLAMSI